MNSQDEMAGNMVSRIESSGFEQLRLQDGSNAVSVVVGNERWDRSHLRRLRQSADLPGLVPVIDADLSSDGKPYVVLPDVQSPTLAAEMGGNSWIDNASAVEAAARATHEAHLRGLFHGALSPDQVLVIDDDVAVAGIGLGLGGAADESYSHWVAPEVAAGADATERSDVYSLGRVLEAALGDSIDDTPRSVRRLIMWSSSDTPEARPPSAQEFASILAEALTSADSSRKTFAPAFIPTAELNSLAATASEKVAAHESSSSSVSGAAGVATAGLAAAGTVGAVSALSDDDGAALDDVTDEVEVQESAVTEVETETEDSIDETIEPDVAEEAATTGELPEGTVEEAAAVTGTFESDAETQTAGFAGSTDEPEISFDNELVDADVDRPAAAETVDLDRQYAEEKRSNKAGIIVGAVLALGLGAVAFLAINSGGEDVDTAVAPTTVQEEEVVEEDPVEEDPAPATTAEVTTTEAPATTAAEEEEEATTTTEAEEEAPAADVEEAAPTQTITGAIAKSDAAVQVAHGIPGVPVDVYVDGNALAPGFEAGTIAGPAQLAAGSYDVDLFAAADSAPAAMADRTDEAVLSETVTVGSKPVTLIAHLDADGNPTLSAVEQDLSDLEPAQGRVEVGHFAAAPAVVLSVDGEEQAGTLSSGQSTTLELDAGEHTLSVALSDGTPVLEQTVNVGDGELASVAVIGSAADESISVIAAKFTGLASAPEAVPTGNSNLLGGPDDQTGMYVLGLITALMAIAGGVIMTARRNRHLL